MGESVTFYGQISVPTRRRMQMIDITGQVQEIVNKSGAGEGVVYLSALHTTAGLTINEDADPDVREDLLAHLERLVPVNSQFRHMEGNSDAHIKASLVGTTLSVPIHEGRLVLGRWQGIFLCEFDGPRTRSVAAQVMGVSPTS